MGMERKTAAFAAILPIVAFAAGAWAQHAREERAMTELHSASQDHLAVDGELRKAIDRYKERCEAIAAQTQWGTQ